MNIKKIIKNLTTPLLCYSEKPEGFVFKNFSLFNDAGYKYSKFINKRDVGMALEYRFKLNKILRFYLYVIPIILYLILIHIDINIVSFLTFELAWLVLVCIIRLICSWKYNKYLIAHFGNYTLVEFQPPLTNEKISKHVKIYFERRLVILVLFLLLFVPSLILPFCIKPLLVGRLQNPKIALGLTNVYCSVYPKTQKILEMQASSRFLIGDYNGALKNYKKIFNMEGKKFTDKDIVRFANLLLIQKIISNPRDAIDLYNEYYTKKSMTILQESEMLWVKTAFKIENNILESIFQDYEDLLLKVPSTDIKNVFYISCDKAYMMSVLQEYEYAVHDYTEVISLASENRDLFEKELPKLYAERGWAKLGLGDEKGAEEDFAKSKFKKEDLQKSKPSFHKQIFVINNF